MSRLGTTKVLLVSLAFENRVEIELDSVRGCYNKVVDRFLHSYVEEKQAILSR